MTNLLSGIILTEERSRRYERCRRLNKIIVNNKVIQQHLLVNVQIRNAGPNKFPPLSLGPYAPDVFTMIGSAYAPTDVGVRVLRSMANLLHNITDERNVSFIQIRLIISIRVRYIDMNDSTTKA